MKIRPVLVIHGGAGDKDLSGSAREIHENAVRAVLDSVYPKLERGMSASEAAAWACALLEDNPLYNAGYGSKIQSDGKIRMSASLMDGHRRRFAGCVNVESVKNPIYLARALMDEKDRVLSGIGAKRFARECGLKFASQYTPEQRISWHQQKEGKAGTVGVIVLDVKGRLAAATSTGGRGFEYPYRVSDSPTSAGNFANEVCAVSATGTGEEIVEQAAAATICAYVETGMPLKKAVAKVIAKARKRGAEFGMIALDRKGNFTAATTTKCIVWAGTDGKSTKTF
jgi:L-asparaginase